jgi:hypothetical protein
MKKVSSFVLALIYCSGLAEVSFAFSSHTIVQQQSEVRLVSWYAELYSKNPDYIEVTVDARRLPSDRRLAKVYYEVTFFDTQNNTLGTKTFSFTKEGESLDRKVYRRYARQPFKSVQSAKGKEILYASYPLGSYFLLQDKNSAKVQWYKELSTKEISEVNNIDVAELPSNGQSQSSELNSSIDPAKDLPPKTLYSAPPHFLILLKELMKKEHLRKEEFPRLNTGCITAKKLNPTLMKAITDGDIDMLERPQAEDFILIDPDGSTYSKAQQRELYTSGNLKFESYIFKGANCNLMQDFTVIVGSAKVKFRYKGKEFNGLRKYIHVYARRQGRWQVIITELR